MTRSTVVKYLLLSLAILPALSSGVGAAAQSGSAQETLVRDLYGSFCADRLWFHPREMEKFLKKSFVQDMVKAEKADLYLDLGCPFVSSQDPDFQTIARTLKVKQQSPTTVLATFDNDGKKSTMIYKLEKTDKRWWVVDILEDRPGHPRSFAKDLSQALAGQSR